MTKLLIIIVGIIFQIAFIIFELKVTEKQALILKGLGSLFFVLLGIACFSGSAFSKWILAGLILGMAGDILLGIQFIVGGAAFLLGHVMYLIAFFRYAAKPWMPVLIGIFVAAGLLSWILRIVKAEPAMKVFGIVYVSIVSLMAMAAVWNGILSGVGNDLILAAGGVMFLISDVILIINMFSEKPKERNRVTIMVLYYAAQMLIAAAGCMHM